MFTYSMHVRAGKQYSASPLVHGFKDDALRTFIIHMGYRDYCVYCEQTGYDVTSSFAV